jgi:8-oxo-dGTP pyrophosphatase MutT (NUDIX family)
MLNTNILYASGILFYSRTLDNTPFFLLGKDYENRWSNFGGRCEISDKFDVETTASRETWEETLGSVYDYETLKNILKSNKNFKYISCKTPSGHPYYMYLVKIPYSPTYRDRFISTKKFLSNIKSESKFLEMTDIKWVSLDTINYSINNNRKSIIKLRYVFEQSFKSNIKEILEIL